MHAQLPRMLKRITDVSVCREKRARVLLFVSRTVSSLPPPPPPATTVEGSLPNALRHAGVLNLTDPLQALVAQVHGSSRVGSAGPMARWGWGSEAQLILGTALLALPHRSDTAIQAGLCKLTAQGIAPIAELIGRNNSLARLVLSDNNLGDAGVSLLAERLPPALRSLELTNAGFGDDGMVALAVVLPKLLGLEELTCGGHAVADAGWRALAGVLPQMKALRNLAISQFGDAGMLTIVSSLPDVPMLESLSAQKSTVGDAGAIALAEVLPRCTTLRRLSFLGSSRLGVAGRAALRAAKESCPWGGDMSIEFTDIAEAFEFAQNPGMMQEMLQQLQEPGMLQMHMAMVQGPEAQAMFQQMGITPEQLQQGVALMANPGAMAAAMSMAMAPGAMAAAMAPAMQALQGNPGALDNLLQVSFQWKNPDFLLRRILCSY